jgi:hypothetical protein
MLQPAIAIRDCSPGRQGFETRNSSVSLTARYQLFNKLKQAEMHRMENGNIYSHDEQILKRGK